MFGKSSVSCFIFLSFFFHLLSFHIISVFFQFFKTTLTFWIDYYYLFFPINLAKRIWSWSLRDRNVCSPHSFFRGLCHCKIHLHVVIHIHTDECVCVCVRMWVWVFVSVCVMELFHICVCVHATHTLCVCTSTCKSLLFDWPHILR